MRRIRLFHVSVVLFAASFVLLGFLASRGALDWSIDALKQYSNGSTTTPQEVTLEARTRLLLQSGGDMTEIRDLIQQTLSIDPNSSAIFMLGELEQREGNDVQALQQFEAYLGLDPSYLPAYWRMSEIYAAGQDFAAQRRILERGLQHFEAEAELYQPRKNRSIASNFNDKAEGVYNYYRESRALLREALDELSPSR